MACSTPTSSLTTPGSSARQCLEHAAVLVDKAEAVGDGSAKATAHVNLDTGEADVSGAQAEVHDVAVGKQRDFWATVAAKPLHIRLREGAWTAVLSGEARNGRAVLDTLGAPGILDIMAGDRPLAATATLRAEHAFVALERLDVKATGVEVTGRTTRPTATTRPATSSSPCR